MFGKLLFCLIVVIPVQSQDIVCLNSECLQCQQGQCLSCNTGSLLNNGQCVACPTNCESCEYPWASQTQIVCKECDQGYTLFQKICILCNITYCQSCQSTNICSSCQTGFVLNSDICGCQENCTCSQNNPCLSCIPGNTFYFGSCFNCPIVNCQNCSAPNLCSQCEQGYQLNNNGTCGPLQPQPQPQPQSGEFGESGSANLGLILGISIPLALGSNIFLILVIIGSFVFSFQKKSSPQEQTVIDDPSDFQTGVRQNFELNTIDVDSSNVK